MLTNRPASRQAHLHSLSLRTERWSRVLARPDDHRVHRPSAPVQSLVARTVQLPLPLTEATCNGCHERWNPLGRHTNACTRSGRVKKRASPTERMLARVCREAGARVKFNACLRDMNLSVPGNDERRIEVLAQDVPCFNGAQLAIDITLRSALGASGEPQRRAGGGRGSACPGSPREGGHIPGAVDFNDADWSWSVGDGATRRQNFFGSLHWPRLRHLLCWLTLLHSPGSAGGRGCSEQPAQLPSLNHWLHRMSPTRGVRQEE